MAGIVSADKRVVLAHVPRVFRSFAPVIVRPYARPRARPPKHVGGNSSTPRAIPIAPRLRALVLITIFKFRPTCALANSAERWMAGVIAADTLACSRVRERDVRAWFTHESYVGPRGRDCWLNIRRLSRSTAPIIHYSTRDRTRVSCASSSVPISGSFLIASASSVFTGICFWTLKVRLGRGTREKYINSKHINGSSYLWSCFCRRTQLKLVLIWHDLNRSCDLIRYVVFVIMI